MKSLGRKCQTAFVLILIIAMCAGCSVKGKNEGSKTPVQEIAPTVALEQDAASTPADEAANAETGKPEDAETDSAELKSETKEADEAVKPDDKADESAEVTPSDADGKKSDTDATDDTALGGNAEGSITDPVIERVTVSDMDSFVEAIKPYTTIILEPGSYDLSNQLEALWYADPEIFNDTHDHVRLLDCFDGTEMIIYDCDHLTITSYNPAGSGETDTELVIDPRYAAVLNFENCSELCLSGIRMGHTERGSCKGNVINLSGCSDVTVFNMDIFGCGVYGISATNGTRDIYVSDTVIRDCAYGPFELYDCQGDVIFENCAFTGSEGSGFCARTAHNQDPKLIFKNCEFGECETAWFFDENCVNEDPVWSEITSYPDYSDDYLEGDGEDQQLTDEEKAEVLKYLDRSAVEEKNFNYTSWYGVAKTDPDTGENVYFDHIGYISEDNCEEYDGFYMWLDANHSGYMVWNGLQGRKDIVWKTDGGSDLMLTDASGTVYNGEIYTNNDGYIRLKLYIEGIQVWLY